VAGQWAPGQLVRGYPTPKTLPSAPFGRLSGQEAVLWLFTMDLVDRLVWPAFMCSVLNVIQTAAD